MLVPQFLLNCPHNLIADKFLRGLALENIPATFDTNLRNALHIILQDPQNVLYGLFVCFIHFPLYHAFDLLHVLGALPRIYCKGNLLHLFPVLLGSAAVSVLRAVKCHIIHTVLHVAGVGFGKMDKRAIPNPRPHVPKPHEFFC